jgi:hypothetical protein
MIDEATKSHFLLTSKWDEFFDQLSGNACTQRISVAVIDPNIGTKKLIHDAPLVTMIYDCPTWGGNLLIKVGREDMAYTYTIDAATEISVRPEFDPEIIKMLVNNAAGQQISIKLQEQESLPQELHRSLHNLAILIKKNYYSADTARSWEVMTISIN